LRATEGRIVPRSQARSKRTRSELLRAAALIFSRDGYEATRLEDIASTANKTRGAIYAHFKDKEDIFLSIFESQLRPQGTADISPRQESLYRLLLEVTSLSEDRQTPLLWLELGLKILRTERRGPRLLAIERAAKVHKVKCEIPVAGQAAYDLR
jgi:AcrR family transcriptional regulator